jgi:tetratricopeptide (TPR) repeat protein
VSAEYVEQQLKRTRLNAPVDTRYTAEDWEGFQQLVRASDIQDKDVILRVLSMYQDPEEREKQIRNMSEAFRELADGILPELRRARLTVNYEIIGRDDAQIKEQLKSDVSKLSVEELLYAATLTDNPGEQLNIYQQTTRLFPQDARAYNNIGNVYFAQGDYEEAGRYYQRALSIDRNCGAAHANIGLLELINGNTAEAENSIGRASTVRRLGETLGNLHLAQGNYALAEQDFGYTASNSAALAQIMNKNYERAAQTLDNIKQADAMTDYLRAILNARQGNNEAAATSLGKAVTKDASLKPLADRDLEMKAVSK